MKIKSLEISLFKGFQKTNLEFTDGLNLLVGANNSGKSSLLQAVYLSFHFLIATKGISEKDKKRKNRLKGFVLRSFPVPLHDDSALSEGLKKRSIRGEKSTYFKIELYDGVSFMEGLTFPGGSPLIISSNIEGKEGSKVYRKRILEIIKTGHPLLIPIFSGVAIKEEIKTKEVISYYVASGRSSEVLRNQLREMPKKNLERLNRYLKSSFDVEISTNETNDIYLSSLYKDDKYKNLDISLAGSGFQQILQILVYIVNSKSEVILIDEPDAHLHCKLQNILYDILAELVREGKQIVVATHSQVFIKNAIEKNDNLILVNKKLDKQKSINEYNNYLKSLYEEGLLDEDDITEKKEVKFIFLEDSEQGNGFKIIKSFLEKLGFKGPEFRIASSEGGGDSVVKYLRKSRDLDRLKFKALLIRDNDSMPDEYLRMIKKKHEDDDILICFLDVNEVENYLLNPKLISKTVNIKDENLQIKAEDVEKMIKRKIKQEKDAIIDILDRCLQGKLQEYYKDIDLKFGDIQGKTREIKNDIRDNKFVFPYNALPGKEMFRMIKAEIHKKYSLDIAELEVACNFSESDIPKAIKDALLFFEK